MSTKQDYIKAIGNLVPGNLPLGEADKIFAISQAVKRYSRDFPRLVVADLAGGGVRDYAVTLLAEWTDKLSSIKQVEYPVDDANGKAPVLDDRAWSIYEKPAGRCLRFLEDIPTATETIRVSYTALHICDDTRCTVPTADEEAVQMLAAASFCDMLATYFSQSQDSVIQADAVDHKSKASEYSARARTYRKLYADALGVQEGTVAAASVTRDQDTQPSWRSDALTHPGRWR